MAVLIFIILSILIFMITRLIYLLSYKNDTVNLKNQRTVPAKTMIILGSGGHTREMMEIVMKLNIKNYSPRIYLLASNDVTSEAKIHVFEGSNLNENVKLVKIYRSRNVHQSYISSIFTTLYSIFNSLPVLLKSQPDLILCNGPGTCVPICLVAFLMKMLFIKTECKIVFIESYCRVRSLSLTGKILIWFVDLFVVQWPKLIDFSNKIKYYGRLS